MAWRVADSLNVLLGQLNAAAPGRSKVSDGSIGDAAHRSRTSDHNPWIQDGGVGVVSARDFTHDPGAGADMASFTEGLRLSRDRRIKYVIHDRRIFAGDSGISPWVWRPYSGSNPHTVHAHVSVRSQDYLYDDTSAWSVLPATEDEDMSEVVEGIQRAIAGAGGDPGPVDGIWGPKTEGALTAALASAPADAKLAVLLRKAPLTIRAGEWTRIPMDTFYGGDRSLFRDGYITGAPGYWMWATYLRFAKQEAGQAMVRFVRDIGGEHDFTGTVDWNFTPGKDYKAHVWPFDPVDGKPTGVEVWSSEPVTLEYAQFKAIRLSTQAAPAVQEPTLAPFTEANAVFLNDTASLLQAADARPTSLPNMLTTFRDVRRAYGG